MLYAISLAKTSVTYHKAVNRVNFLESSFSQVLSTDKALSCIFNFSLTTQYLFDIVTGREILVPFLSIPWYSPRISLEGFELF